MHAAFLTVNVKYLGHIRIVFQSARYTYCFLHIRETLFADVVDLMVTPHKEA